MARNACPTEDQEQAALMAWAQMQTAARPELALLHHIPNGGARNARTGARLKAQGVKRGVPDLCLPVARGGYHGLYIELKRQHGGQVSQQQRWWLNQLRANGYAAQVCNGWQEARWTILRYIEGGKHNEQPGPAPGR